MSIFFDSKTLILIGGATATGKSGAAVALATALDGSVINADSMQLYDGLPILTACPTAAVRKKVPHALYGVLPPTESASAVSWLQLLDQAIEKSETNALVVVGGTGLYLSALMYGLSPIPDISEALRHQIRQQANSLLLSSGTPALYECVATRDPLIRGRVHPNHTQRLIRAWEVIEQTGKSIVLWQKEPRQKNFYTKSPLFIFDLDRAQLDQKIHQRCVQMFADGVTDEVQTFLDQTSGVFCTPYKAIGFAEVREYLQGKCTQEEAIERMVIATRQYAKRQQTWFRTQYPAADVSLVRLDEGKSPAARIIDRLYASQL